MKTVSPLVPVTPSAALVLASGRGPDRDRPWDTLPVAGVPMVLRVLRHLATRGVERVVLHAERRGDLYRRLVGCGATLGLQVVHSSGLLPDGIEGLLAEQREFLRSAEGLLIQPSDAALLRDDRRTRVLALRSWQDLHALTLEVLAGRWRDSEPQGGSAAAALVRGRSQVDQQSYVAEDVVAEARAVWIESSLEQGARVGAGAVLERVILLPGAEVLPGSELREGLVDGRRWIPLEGSADAAAAADAGRRSWREWLANALARLQPSGRVELSRVGAARRARVVGDLDRGAAAELARLSWPQEQPLVVDLGECEAAAPVGLRALRDLAARPGVCVALADAPPRLRDALDRSGLSARLPLYPTFAAARAALAGAAPPAL